MVPVAGREEWKNFLLRWIFAHFLDLSVHGFLYKETFNCKDICKIATNINTLFKKQKSAIRIVCQEKHFSHTEPLFKSLLILPLPSLVEFFKLQFMQQYVRGLLPVSFNNLWITNEAHRAQATPMVLRNDAEFFIPSSRLAQCSLLPYYSFPRSWRDFDQLNPAISILRNKNEFNTELKHTSLKNFLLPWFVIVFFALLVHPLKPQINSC